MPNIRKRLIPALFMAAALVLSGFTPLSANVPISRTMKDMKIVPGLEYLQDKGGQLTIDDVIKSGFEAEWRKSETGSPGFGFTDSAYWVRFTAENSSLDDISFLLVENYPLIDRVELFIPLGNGKFSTIESGRLKNFSDRPYKNRKLVIPVTIKAGSTATYYLRQTTSSSMNFMLRIWSPEYFEEHAMNEYGLLILYYSILALMFIYNLCLFFFMRRLEYLYYPFFVLFLLLFIMCENGTAVQFLWPEHPAWGNYFILVALNLLVIFALQFTKTFLELKKNHPAQHRILQYRIFPAIYTVTVLCLFLTYRHAMVLSALTAGLSLCYGFFIGAFLLTKKERNAYFYLISWIFFLAGSSLYILMAFGVIPATFISIWSIQVGSIFQVVLLSIALADRINSMRKELLQLNTGLEEKVTERTSALNTAMDELEKANILLVDAQIELWGEMKLAKKIQTILLPENPRIEGYEVTAFMATADDVGGDYYDIINTGDTDWIAIGDVSGHGVPAGLVMMMVQTSIQVVLKREPGISPSRLLTHVNDAITKNIKKLDEDKYMTITVLSAQRDGKFIFSGLHQNLLIFRSYDGKVESVESPGIWIGVLNSIQKTPVDSTVQLHTGDTLFLYTDGITEAWEKGSVRDKRDAEKHMFGEERLIAILEKNGNKSPDEIRDEVLKELGNYDCNDDITMVILRRL